MNRTTLQSLGINTRTDIPASEIFSPAILDYGLTEEDLSRISLLKDFVQEYNREKPIDNTISITNSGTAAELMKDTLRMLTDREEVWIVFLNTANYVIRKEMNTSGSIDASIIDIKRIIKSALDANATGLLLYHNHPSGNPEPSTADIRQTEKLKKALEVFEIKLVDHIIIGSSKYFSFAEESSRNYIN